MPGIQQIGRIMLRVIGVKLLKNRRQGKPCLEWFVSWNFYNRKYFKAAGRDVTLSPPPPIPLTEVSVPEEGLMDDEFMRLFYNFQNKFPFIAVKNTKTMKNKKVLRKMTAIIFARTVSMYLQSRILLAVL